MTERAPRIHLSLRVQPGRLASMVEFYSTLFGEPPRKRFADYVQFDLAEPPLNLTFMPASAARTGEIDHLGLQVFSGEALDASRARLAAAGLSPRDELAVDCCYARQDKFWLTDPEGRQVEVFRKLADLERHGPAVATAPGTPATTACCAPGCCETA
ncbi:MAG TPA: ArsI/CadI family heavy metal resistance metalloenzyme [Planctomycetota bacterium]|nr:ArsI/CadI family heavy metal resistance metalloenzyme [Planctomycetota bacterium]